MIAEFAYWEFRLYLIVWHSSEEKWIHLYVERWLKAPLQQKDGQLVKRDRGTPQGGVISPLLANIFMHHAFDVWLEKYFPHVKFERFADDSLVHCYSLKQAEDVLAAIKKRLQECGLELHPEKTEIVYCKDVDRKESHAYGGIREVFKRKQEKANKENEKLVDVLYRQIGQLTEIFLQVFKEYSRY